MVKKVNATLGAVYFLQNDNNIDKLQLIAHYGLSKEALVAEVDLQEGLVGKCFTTGDITELNDLPKGFFDINSGLGNATPKQVSLYPMTVDEKTIGVFEIASFKAFSNAQKEFLLQSINNIAAQLNIVKMNSESKSLLSTYEQYEQELKQKDEEFRQVKEELESLREQIDQA